MFGIGRRNTPEAFRKACKRFIFIENLLGDGEGLRETVEPGQGQPLESGPEARKPIARSELDAPTGETSLAAQDKTETVETVQKQTPSKAVPLIKAAMRAHDDDWVPLSVIGSHVRAANPEFDPRTYGCAKLVDLMQKTGQFEVKRNEIPVRARMKRLQ